MRKKITLLCFFCIFVYAKIPQEKLFARCDLPKNFNANQKQIILDSYFYAQKKGFGYMLAAIAWQESCAGEYLINFSDPSAGIFHAHIPLVLKQYTNLKNTAFNRNLMGRFLIQNQDFAMQVALEQLIFWNQKYSGDKQKILKSYNKGTSWISNEKSNALAQKYYQEVFEKIKLLQDFIPNEVKKSQNQQPVIKESQPLKKPKNDFYLLPEP